MKFFLLFFSLWLLLSSSSMETRPHFFFVFYIDREETYPAHIRKHQQQNECSKFVMNSYRYDLCAQMQSIFRNQRNVNKKEERHERRYCLRFGLSFYAKQCIWQESSKRSPKRIEWQPNDKGMKAILQSNKQEISYCHIWRSLRKLCLCALQ